MTARPRRARRSDQLIVTPRRCHGPRRDARLWGFAAQLYGVRSARNWGMGDLTDLAELAEQAAALGAATVGVNPLHALFPADANHISPYSPSSRLFLNVLYLDPEAVPDFAECSEARGDARRSRPRAEIGGAARQGMVDYPAVVAHQAARARAAVPSLRTRHLASSQRARARRSPTSAREMGEALEQHATFDALHEHMLRRPPGPGHGSTGRSRCAIPATPRSPPSPSARATHRVLRLAAVAGRSSSWRQRRRAPGPRACAIGLYQDLAVAVNPAAP